jgi:hypothetical protein
MATLTHKGYGRIYCETADDIPRVKAVVEELDDFEFGYLPEGLVTVCTEYPRVIYNGKFSDLDMDILTAVCWSRGIRIWVFDSGHNEMPISRIPVHMISLDTGNG